MKIPPAIKDRLPPFLSDWKMVMILALAFFACAIILLFAQDFWRDLDTLRTGAPVEGRIVAGEALRSRAAGYSAQPRYNARITYTYTYDGQELAAESTRQRAGGLRFWSADAAQAYADKHVGLTVPVYISDEGHKLVYFGALDFYVMRLLPFWITLVLGALLAWLALAVRRG